MAESSNLCSAPGWGLAVSGACPGPSVVRARCDPLAEAHGGTGTPGYIKMGWKKHPGCSCCSQSFGSLGAPLTAIAGSRERRIFPYTEAKSGPDVGSSRGSARPRGTPGRRSPGCLHPAGTSAGSHASGGSNGGSRFSGFSFLSSGCK